MFGWTSKNYYRIVLMHSSWLRNLFHDLTTNNAWIIYVSSKAMKLWKHVTLAMDLEIQNWKYRYKAYDGNFDTFPLHRLTTVMVEVELSTKRR